eukprot:scaffold20320_cov51-Prasinocladus_malaysianus.AAC.4
MGSGCQLQKHKPAEAKAMLPEKPAFLLKGNGDAKQRAAKLKQRYTKLFKRASGHAKEDAAESAQ